MQISSCYNCLNVKDLVPTVTRVFDPDVLKKPFGLLLPGLLPSASSACIKVKWTNPNRQARSAPAQQRCSSGLLLGYAYATPGIISLYCTSISSLFAVTYKPTIRIEDTARILKNRAFQTSNTRFLRRCPSQVTRGKQQYI